MLLESIILIVLIFITSISLISACGRANSLLSKLCGFCETTNISQIELASNYNLNFPVKTSCHMYFNPDLYNNLYCSVNVFEPVARGIEEMLVTKLVKSSVILNCYVPKYLERAQFDLKKCNYSSSTCWFISFGDGVYNLLRCLHGLGKELDNKIVYIVTFYPTPVFKYNDASEINVRFMNASSYCVTTYQKSVLDRFYKPVYVCRPSIINYKIRTYSQLLRPEYILPEIMEKDF